MSDVVRLEQVSLSRGGQHILRAVDWTVRDGERWAVLGPNGAGKTSLLRACAGLLEVSDGEAQVLGHDLRRDPADVRRRVGLLGHAAPLYEELTPRENLRFVLRAARLAPALADPALERVGITGRLTRTPVGRLSAGQRRRTALAVLVARQPELWLLDEPHTSLDGAARQLLASLVTDAAASGAAVLMSSHEPDLAVPLADRVVTMGGGRVTSDQDRTASLVEPPRPLPLAGVRNGGVDVA